jgi:hypothetical protein
VLREEILAQFLETGTSDGSVEVDTFEERVDFDGGLSCRGESSLGTLASSAQTTDSTGIGGEILLVLALEFLGKVVDETAIEVLTTQVGVTSSGLDFEDTFFDGQEGNIKSSSSEIEDENVTFTRDLLVKTVCDSSSGGLVDDTKNVKASNGTSVLGSLTLRIVEVGRNSNDGVVDSSTKVGLSNFPHLGEDHGRHFFGREFLLLATVLYPDVGLAILAENREGEVLDIGLDLGIVEFTTDESLGIEDGVVGVHGDLILGSISDETLAFRESDI